MFEAAYHYFLANRPVFWQAVSVHVYLSVLALAIGGSVSIPLGL
jgi:ABC-type proline/glycine betaine transport system permease subunit